MKKQSNFKIYNYLAVAGLLAISACGGDRNKAPEPSSNTVSAEINSSVDFTLQASDPDGDSITYALTQQPMYGTLETIDGNSHTYRYTPNTDSRMTDSVSFSASDGKLTANGTVTINIVDTTSPMVTSNLPATNAVRVSTTSDITVAFDDFMLSLNYDAADTGCNGGIQVSADDFTTCEAFADITLQADNKTFVLTFANALMNEKNYQVKVTNDAHNFSGTAAVEAVVGGFMTEAADLRITEVSSSYWADDNRWIEVYNGTSQAVDLSNYTLKSHSINNEDGYAYMGIRNFPISSIMLEPGNYAILQGRHSTGSWQVISKESSQFALIGHPNDNIRPRWFVDGFVELMNAAGTETVDFIRFGTETQVPTNAEHWVGDDAAPQMTWDLGVSLVRSLSHTDTNAATDWTYALYATPGGDNDVTACDTDADEDGIPDCAEVEGSTFAGLPLYDWGARAGVKDIFIEIDYMESEDPGVTPHKAGLQKVVDVFAAKGYAMHLDVGDLFHQQDGLSAADFDLGGGNQVDFYAQTTFASTEASPSVLDHKIMNFDIRRRSIFHYLLMASSQNADGSGGSSGVAEIYGNDLIVTMGNWGFSMETEAAANTTINMQASTIMHELGHNLGILHGGNENTNWKPNHLSIMNYMYQLNGLPTIGDREGDRYYRRFFWDNLNCNLAGNTLTFAPSVATADFKMDYSSGGGAAINEASVDETKGLGRTGSVAVDFNCNGNDAETLVNLDVNNDGNNAGVLNDVNEWDDIVELRFTRYWSGVNSGPETKNSSLQSKSSLPARREILSNDKQELIYETAPSKDFFDRLRSIK
ncbi:Ig-like domain-containing protein [Aliikangiella sp. IMCC44359]|uniref:Ig-like domain-containing protein n=1 Tax=Aliikangiella sp. IMCC44359 TaxID=3459125 RepID=UPI00403AD40C